MFDQSLNLLPQRFRKVHVAFDAYKIIAVISVSIVLTLAVSGGIAFTNYQLNQELLAAEEETKAINQKIQDFKAKNSKNTLDETIAVRINKYEKMLRQRQTFLQKLNGENFGNTEGFSEYLLALARKKLPNIWIEELAIQGDAKAFGIKGKAVLPTDITVYLQSLQEEPAMDGIVFEDLNLARESHPKGNFVLFSISYGTFSGGAGFDTGLSKALANAGLPNVSRR